MVTGVEYDAGLSWSDSYSVDVIVPSLDAVSEVFELGDVCGVRAGLAVDLAPIFQGVPILIVRSCCSCRSPSTRRQQSRHTNY